MMTYRIIQEGSSQPLAVLRANKDTFGIVLDRTGGEFEKQFGNDFKKLRDSLVSKSYIQLVADEEPVPFTRYLLSTGDVLEISNDKATIVLDNAILTDADKASLMQQIQAGQLKIMGTSERFDGTQDAPIKAPEIPTPKPPKAELPAAMLKNQQLDEQSSVNYDPRIDDTDFYTLDPEFTRALAYKFKYNKYKGGRDA
jgi:hypothetical protein